MQVKKEKTDFGSRWEIGEEGQFRFVVYRYDDKDDALYLSNVYVEEECRGRGYGNRILTIAENIARRWHASSIRLWAEKDGFAYNWYLRHGYEDMGKPYEGKPNNVWMEKEVGL